MKKFYLAGVLGALLCASPLMANAAPKADATKAPVKIPVVTRDNFVSIELSQYGGRRLVDNQTTIEGNALSYAEKASIESVIRNSYEKAPLSNNQVSDLIRRFNEAELTIKTVKNSKPAPPDTIEKNLVVTISDSQNLDHSYVLFASSNPAKRRKFSELIAYLEKLREQKIPYTLLNPRRPSNPYAPELPDTIMRRNFQSLTLETTGGFAGIRSLIEVRLPRETSSNISFLLSWSQTIGGRETKADAKLSPQNRNEIFRLLNAANLPSLNGKNFKQKNLADGFGEVLTLKLKDGQTFTVSNYGDTAPPEYSALVQYLNELKNKTLASE